MNFSTKNKILCWLSVTLATFHTKSRPDWFAQLTTGTIQQSNLFFDFTTSLEFLSRVHDTSLFSPFCCDINLHTQMYQGEFGPEYIEMGKRKLECIKPALSNQDSKFVMANNVYLPSRTTSTSTNWEPLFLLENYRIEDASSVHKKHQEWTLEKTKGKISSPLKKSNFEYGERIYSSIVYFKDFWLDKFDIDYTTTERFNLRDGNVITRKFMSANESYKYRLVENDICDFEMVAIPYEDKLRRWVFKRYMIYLIPKNSAVKSSKLWKSFYRSCEDGISHMLSDTRFKQLKLSIPKIEGLESELNLCDIIGDLFKEHKALNMASSMKTFLQVDEEGTTAIALMNTCCTDGPSPPSTVVKANVPYIAFIYDVSIERILFVLKDEGFKLY